MTCHKSLWYLAQFKPNSHNIAGRNLLRQGFSVFLPMRKETRRVRNTFAVQMLPLFPGYLFLSTGPEQGDLGAVNSTFGVSRLLSLGKDPVIVPRGLVAQLMQRCDDLGAFLPAELPKPGDMIVPTVGPFADFVAQVEVITPDQRIWVLLDLLGGQTRVQISAKHIRAL
jgi:transcriptional antiterminator RfaH